MNARQKKKIKSGLFYGIECWFDDNKKIILVIPFVALSPIKHQYRRNAIEDSIEDFTDNLVVFPTKQNYLKHNNQGIKVARKYISKINIGE